MTPHYRIWSKEDNKFLSINVDNYILKYQGDCWLLCPFSQKDKYWPFVRVNDNDNFVIQRFTELKDRNGKDIYDGDIIKLVDENALNYDAGYILEVKWHVTDYDCFWFNMPEDFVVIGNIFENPELLCRKK